MLHYIMFVLFILFFIVFFSISKYFSLICPLFFFILLVKINVSLTTWEFLEVNEILSFFYLYMVIFDSSIVKSISEYDILIRFFFIHKGLHPRPILTVIGFWIILLNTFFSFSFGDLIFILRLDYLKFMHCATTIFSYKNLILINSNSNLLVKNKRKSSPQPMLVSTRYLYSIL